MGVRDRLARLVGGKALKQRFNLGQYPQFLSDFYSQFSYAGALYPLQQSMSNWSKTEEISSTLPSYMVALRKSPPAFAAQLVRASVLSQARLIFRNRVDRHVFRTNELRVLERPWVNGTTGELLGRMEWNAGLAGNAYVYRQGADRLRVLRPDWVMIVYGSQSEPDDPKGALDGEVVGYAYKNGGFTQQNKNAMTVILPEQMAHWTPLPDPMSPGLGMSWLTPALRDLQSDTAAEEYKLGFFTNGATPNLVVKASTLVPNVTPTQFKEWVDMMEATHKGSANAFKTLYLQPGADASVIGSNLQDLDLSSITSHGETRISYLSRVPAVILGIAAGLKGSSLNAGNYGEARRNFADSWYYSTLQDACAALGAIINSPGGSELWYDVADVPLLREDAKDAAGIEQIKATTINSYVMSGFTPESAVAAVVAQDVNLLVHTNLFSVQLQPPMPNGPPSPESGQPMSDTPAAQASRETELTGALVRSSELIDRLATREFPAPVTNVTVERGPTPEVRIDAPITVTQPDVYLTVNPAEMHLEQPITVNTPPVTIEPADVTVNVQPANAPDVTLNVQPANAPQVHIEAPITVQPADVSVTSPAVTVQPAVVNVTVPQEPPSHGVTVDYNEDGSIAGVTPKRKRK